MLPLPPPRSFIFSIEMSILKLQKLPSICLLFEIQSALLSLWPWFLYISFVPSLLLYFSSLPSNTHTHTFFCLFILYNSILPFFHLQCFFIISLYLSQKLFFVCHFLCKKRNDISMLIAFQACMIIVTFSFAIKKNFIQLEKSINFHLSELFVLLANLLKQLLLWEMIFLIMQWKSCWNMCMLSDRKSMIKVYYRCSLDCFQHHF